MAKNNHEDQLRVSGQFASNPDKPAKKQLSLKVDAGMLELYRARHGKGFSSKLAKVIEEFMRTDNENSIPNID
ncbi:MAG: hypothetical protein AAFS12_00025 [Cyanobacteria bacterium J06632_19]